MPRPAAAPTSKDPQTEATSARNSFLRTTCLDRPSPIAALPIADGKRRRASPRHSAADNCCSAGRQRLLLRTLRAKTLRRASPRYSPGPPWKTNLEPRYAPVNREACPRLLRDSSRSTDQAALAEESTTTALDRSLAAILDILRGPCCHRRCGSERLASAKHQHYQELPPKNLLLRYLLPLAKIRPTCRASRSRSSTSGNVTPAPLPMRITPSYRKNSVFWCCYTCFATAPLRCGSSLRGSAGPINWGCNHLLANTKRNIAVESDCVH